MLWGVVTTITEGKQKSKRFFFTFGILRFYSPKNKKDLLSWARAVARFGFAVRFLVLS